MPTETIVRVRYAETDTMGVVYYANHLVYMEVGRVEYLRQRGHAMSDVNEKIHMPVVEAMVKYVKPARLDDLLRVKTWVGELKRVSFTFSYEIAHADTGELIATGQTRHACWEPKTGKVIPVPDWLKAVLTETVPDGG
jgi:acyl-CoA thioester hydrolase